MHRWVRRTTIVPRSTLPFCLRFFPVVPTVGFTLPRFVPKPETQEEPL
jgi:hypothetical protein